MTILKMLCDWLENIDWVKALVQADIVNSGTANSFLQANHVTKTRQALQVTATILYTLLQEAYND